MILCLHMKLQGVFACTSTKGPISAAEIKDVLEGTLFVFYHVSQFSLPYLHPSHSREKRLFLFLLCSTFDLCPGQLPTCNEQISQ